MIRNYIKIALRNILRYKASSMINVSGLAIGLCSVILIALFIQDELQYDQFFEDSAQIFRVNVEGKMGENEFYAGYTPPPAGAKLVNNFPEIESYTRIFRPGVNVLQNSDDQEKQFNEDNIFAVDANFLELLSYPLAKGDPKTCLAETNSIVITPQVAKKYFGEADPMGKILLYGEDKSPMKVTGVLHDLEDLPASVKFDILVPVENFGVVNYFNWSWVWLNMVTYVKVTEQAAANPGLVQHLESQFSEMLRVQAADAFKRIGQPYEEFLEKGNKWDFHMQPLADIHLHSGDIVSSITEHNNIKNLYIFGIIALFIIILACVNFMNLATAQSSRRTKEIGIRKVLGSARSQLIRQFLTEAALFSFIATMLAVLLTILFLPVFNEIAGKSIGLQNLIAPEIWMLILGLALVTAVLAGVYPAFYLTSFAPVNILKGGIGKNFKSRFIRNELVVFQFIIAIALIISTIIVYTQLDYANSRDLGYDRENIIILNNTEKLGAAEEAFRQEIAALPQIKSTTISSNVFTKGAFGDFYVPETNEPGETVSQDLALSSYLVDDRFIETLDLKLKEGRGFERRFNDSLSVVINETAARQIGWENPLGKTIRYPGGQQESYTVVGVLKDFNVQSLHTPIEPFALFSKSSQSYTSPTSYITVKLNPGNPQRTIQAIEAKWQEFQANVPFEYSFLDEDLAAAYVTDRRLAKLFGIFTSLAIFVACLGLFGLVAFTAQQRTKEIGIRKVVGAGVTDIVRLLSVDFIKLVCIAVIIASPLAWYGMSRWLQDFAYRIDIAWWMFALAGSFALMIALLTVSFQAVKAAVANPVKSLRTE
ncbi:FtsX-like permease family protein [Antarcticibacterium flavum]|uniref:FtsX-like permease family protein n=1 Tax=Antarcticibacterium flavum TaxID=2058175 RepID=A0A5B7X8J9_9FLAO|nr:MULTISPECIES: ABC transporter permease [Antarcticibacterium]MCM4161482.1 ABC transporter permease [Antarcticibacterium sp. W02-3]QCY71068.1 FtsX-like permease family protein [Antarcticibacterium flavum]